MSKSQGKSLSKRKGQSGSVISENSKGFCPKNSSGNLYDQFYKIVFLLYQKSYEVQIIFTWRNKLLEYNSSTLLGYNFYEIQ